MRQKAGHDPLAVAVVIGGNSQLATIGHGTRQIVEKRRLHDTPFVVPLFGPGIGKQKKNPSQ